MFIDRAGWPFVAIAAVPAGLAFVFGATITGTVLLVLPVAIGAFFRDPERSASQEPGLVVSPADGKVMHAGDADARRWYAPPRRGGGKSPFFCPHSMSISIARQSPGSSPEWSTIRGRSGRRIGMTLRSTSSRRSGSITISRR